MELTKERLQQIVHAAGLEPCDHEEVFDSITTGEIVMMARQLLAGIEHEPVMYQYHTRPTWNTNHPWSVWIECSAEVYSENERYVSTPDGAGWVYEVRKLYAAPQLPQPAVAITQHFDTIALDTAKMVMCDVNRRDEFLGGDIQLLSRIQCRIDEACRAAMLQGAEPVSQPYTLPDGWVDCSERMPDGMQTVITSNGFDIGQGWWDGEGWNSFDSHDVVPGKVTHWMPRPAAPQQEAE